MTYDNGINKIPIRDVGDYRAAVKAFVLDFLWADKHVKQAVSEINGRLRPHAEYVESFKACTPIENMARAVAA